ncbi:MAG TPA: hypothetical protein VG605_09015, partial [Puia sp.]|nr:hypothetical protein [Puia sp.]
MSHASDAEKAFVHIRGAREHNLKNVSLKIPRDALVVFTGVSGSGKSSLAFGTLYAEAQRRYLESVSPYTRRLFHQMPVPQVDAIEGLPPAVALQQHKGGVSTRSSVGSVTTISNLLRMLYSRAGDYPKGQGIVYAEGFSPNTPEGACPTCHGLGKVYEVTEQSMVPDDSLTIREKAIAAWPLAWQGQNLRDILTTLGYNVDIPWRDLPKKDRDWILFTEETPTVPVYPGFTRQEVKQAIKQKIEPGYMGTFTGARRYVLHTFANTQSAMMKKRVSQYMISAACPTCHGKRLRPESLAVKFAGVDSAEMSRLPLKRLAVMFERYADSGDGSGVRRLEGPGAAAGAGVRRSDERGAVAGAGARLSDEKAIVAQRIARDMVARLHVLLDLGLGYLTLERSTPTLSPGELQRLRLATQVYSNLFGVVYVLDEPSAGLHPSDTEALLRALDKLKTSGNSLFVVEHEIEIIRHADWVIDVGPDAGEHGGEILYSGPLDGLRKVAESRTRTFVFGEFGLDKTAYRQPRGWLKLADVSINNLDRLRVEFPLGVLTSVTGVSGSGKSSLVSHALVSLVAGRLGASLEVGEGTAAEDALQEEAAPTAEGTIVAGLESIRRLVVVDQKPIGRTPRSNLAT